MTAESEFGYRVEEVLFGVNTTAAGRSNQITGAMTIDGTHGDRGVVHRRRGVDHERREPARQPVPRADHGDRPVPRGHVHADARRSTSARCPPTASRSRPRATGDLTLHGVTRPVTFDVTAQAGDDRIGVLGTIPILFADYDIDNPSTSGITTEDNGLLEFVLVFVPA